MTRNQIEYAKLLETTRSNKAGEELTSRRDAETQRHNKTTEEQQYVMLGETRRHNQETERMQGVQIAETGRHNLALEGETVRHNQATEVEARKQRETSERLKDRELGIRYGELSEKTRSAMAIESLRSQELEETKRHNIVGEVAVAGHYAAQALHDQQSISLGRDQLNHQIGRDSATLLEQTRHNMAMESKNVAPNITVTTGDTNVSNPVSVRQTSDEGSGLNVTSDKEYPPESAKQGGTVFQKDGKFYRTDGQGHFYEWKDYTPFSVFRTYRWSAIPSDQLKRYDFSDWGY